MAATYRINPFFICIFYFYFLANFLLVFFAEIMIVQVCSAFCYRKQKNYGKCIYQHLGIKALGKPQNSGCTLMHTHVSFLKIVEDKRLQM